LRFSDYIVSYRVFSNGTVVADEEDKLIESCLSENSVKRKIEEMYENVTSVIIIKIGDRDLTKEFEDFWVLKPATKNPLNILLKKSLQWQTLH